jgi:hypothetical protein
VPQIGVRDASRTLEHGGSGTAGAYQSVPSESLAKELKDKEEQEQVSAEELKEEV